MNTSRAMIPSTSTIVSRAWLLGMRDLLFLVLPVEYRQCGEGAAGAAGEAEGGADDRRCGLPVEPAVHAQDRHGNESCHRDGGVKGDYDQVLAGVHLCPPKVLATQR